MLYLHFSEPVFSSAASGTLGVSLPLQAHWQDRRAWMRSALTGPGAPSLGHRVLPEMSSPFLLPFPSAPGAQVWMNHSPALMSHARYRHKPGLLCLFGTPALLSLCLLWKMLPLPPPSGSDFKTPSRLAPDPWLFRWRVVPVTGATSWDLCRLLWDRTSLPGDQTAAVSLTRFLFVTLKV